METLLSVLCAIFLTIHCVLAVTFVINSVNDIIENRKRSLREEERDRRDREYHKKRVKDNY